MEIRESTKTIKKLFILIVFSMKKIIREGTWVRNKLFYIESRQHIKNPYLIRIKNSL